MSWRIPIVDLAAEYAEVAEAVEPAVLSVLRSGRYVLGPEGEAFEAELADLVGSRFAVAVGSGTEALHLILRALGIGPGDEVVTPAFTYFATVEAIVLAGATPRFADVETDGFHLDPSAFEAAIGPRTRAVIPVHLFGRCADLPAIAEIADRHGLAVVEDAAQAIGAARGGRRAGAFGVAAAFSFYPSKNLGAAGDGGCVTTSDAALAARIRLLRSHGLDADGRHRCFGTTSRLDALQAALLRAKLPYLKSWADRRVRNARCYTEALAGCPGLVLPGGVEDEEIVWNQYTLRCRRLSALRDALTAAGIEWRRYYERPACDEPAFAGLAGSGPPLPETRRACAEALSLPVRPSLSVEAIREIAAVIRGALER